MEPDLANDEQRTRVTDRAEAQADRNALAAEGLDTTDLDEQIGELDQQITDVGLRGTVVPRRPRRHRSTRRRQDAAPLPRRTIGPRTVGKTYTAPDGKTSARRVYHADLPELRPGLRGRSRLGPDRGQTSRASRSGWPGVPHFGQSWMRRIWPCPAPKPKPWLET